MEHITWRKSLQACGAVLSFSVMTGLGSDMVGQRAVVVAAEDLVKDAATVEELAKIIDLKTLPIPDGSVVTGERHLGSLNYEISGDLKPALEFQRKQLVTLGWKELPGSMAESAYCSASFQKSNFTVTVMSYAGSTPDKKSSQVFINSLGNVNLSKLPIVKGAKSTHSTVAAVGYTTELKPIEASDATRKLLLDSGWEPYGSQSVPPDSVVMTFKRNAIRLNVFAGPAPAQQGKVMISYSVNVMAADIPAPPNAEMVGLDDTTKTLRFESPDEYVDVAKFYQQRLAKMSWKSTTSDLVTSKDNFQRQTAFLIFRNAAKDAMTLNLERINDKTHGRMSLLTAAEVVAAEQREKAAAEKFVAENKAREEAAQTKPAAKKPAMKAGAKSDNGFPDVDALIKDAVGDALKDVGLDGKKPANGTAKGNAADELRLKGLPIPEGATGISSVKQRGDVRFNVTSDFKTIGNFYAKQLGEQRWTKSGKDNLQQDFWVQTFAKDKMSLQVRVAKREDGSEVRLTPTGLLWDDDAQPSPKNVPIPKVGKNASADGPARPEKAKKGIDKLPKLTSGAKVVVNGETISLPHVLAYEAVSAGEWVTRIVATDKPLKQETLIEQLKFPGENRDFDLPASQWLRLELDHKDRPDALNFAVHKFQTSAGRRNFKGEAIVEDGRVRGSIQTKEPVEFGGRTITAEITFDVPLLTRDSKPGKQLSDAPKPETSEPDKPKKGIAKLPKLASSGTLLVNDKPIKLASVVAYEVKTFDDKRTAIFFTEKPINMEKLKAALKKDGSDSGLFETQSQVKVEIDKDDRPAMMSLWCDGASLNSNSDLIGDVIVEDGRARGTVKLGKPSEFFGKTFSFEITFDVEVLLLPAATSE